MTVKEILVAALIGVIAWISLNISYWKRVSGSISKKLPNDRSLKWIIRPIWISITTFLLFFLIAEFSNIGQYTSLEVIFVANILIPIIPIVGYGFYLKRLKKHVPNQSEPMKVVLLLTAMLAGIPILGIIPIVLWALGTIRYYSVAFILSVSILVWLIIYTRKEVEKRANSTINPSGILESGPKSG